MNIEYSHNQSRVTKAKISENWPTKTTIAILKLFTVFLSFVGVAAIIFNGQTSAWILGIPTLLFIFMTWLRDDAMHNPATLKGSSPESINLNLALTNDILGHLKDPNSFDGIWQATQKSYRAAFIANRFGISAGVFDLGANDEGVAGRIWQESYRLAVASGQDQITGGMVFVALLSQIPSCNDYLAALHIEYSDLEHGLGWQHHIDGVVEKYNSKNFLGGIARDWTSGYAPILSKLGVNVSTQIQHGGGVAMRDIESHQQSIDQMLNVLSSNQRSNIVMIGELGVGKTTTVYAFADRLLSDKSIPGSVKFKQVYSLDATSLIANQKVMGSLENLIIAIIKEAAKAKNIILFFDNAEMFFKQEVGTLDIRNLMQQLIEQSGVPVILALTPNDWQQVTQNNDQLAASANKIMINRPSEEDVIRILQDSSITIEYQNKVVFTYQSLVEAYRLAGHYIPEGEFPGKAIKLMESAAQFAEGGYVNEQSVQKSIESSTGVKVQRATGQESANLLNLEDKIHERMINQTRAVKVVSDALRRSRSGVSNPNRPIGTFLFMGPTGVGKTELSKAISSVYFGGDDNIVRIDLNEYNSEDSGQRLIDANDIGGRGLISQMRKQPFSVVLFDEIEKAHPKVLDLFLQVLDEGVLRDSSNKEVSFKDAIIIATSNAAAGEIQKLIADGHNLEEIEDQFVSSLISSGIFKPEFLNRFDEIVLFRPLKKEELLQVVDLILASVNETLSRQKVTVSLDAPAKQWLVDKGFDERLGARPLRRIVQKTVENIVAKKLLDQSASAGSAIELTTADLETEHSS